MPTRTFVLTSFSLLIASGCSIEPRTGCQEGLAAVDGECHVAGPYETAVLTCETGNIVSGGQCYSTGARIRHRTGRHRHVVRAPAGSVVHVDTSPWFVFASDVRIGGQPVATPLARVIDSFFVEEETEIEFYTDMPFDHSVIVDVTEVEQLRTDTPVTIETEKFFAVRVEGPTTIEAETDGAHAALYLSDGALLWPLGPEASVENGGLFFVRAVPELEAPGQVSITTHPYTPPAGRSASTRSVGHRY